MIIYALLPMVRNTYTGLTNIDAGILEAAKGMGSTRMQILIEIKLPLALPVIMSGIRSMVTMTIALGGLLIEQDTDLYVEITQGVGGGTSNIQPGMESKEFDLYPEYTGTAWNMVLKRKDFYTEKGNTPQKYRICDSGQCSIPTYDSRTKHCLCTASFESKK